ncbi:uncharacterized protein N7482_006033 [Penicillium canariense]|uniref:Uncharacterized protein n=1 Tax=Penicillium canariense TaxID=189055 RepID=A0A9W9I960_9EURO|nr:uncharacterized protein N7482_006033 [Penicillium canariense]KAJ5167252.1 hypothetical protein N7482_006033 [Penicillium canariense]
MDLKHGEASVTLVSFGIVSTVEWTNGHPAPTLADDALLRSVGLVQVRPENPDDIDSRIQSDTRLITSPCPLLEYSTPSDGGGFSSWLTVLAEAAGPPPSPMVHRDKSRDPPLLLASSLPLGTSRNVEDVYVLREGPKYRIWGFCKGKDDIAVAGFPLFSRDWPKRTPFDSAAVSAGLK